MIVTLTFVACLIASPTDCKTVRPLMTEPLNPLSCQIAGMVEGAKWAEENRGYSIAKVRCTVGNRPTPKNESL